MLPRAQLRGFIVMDLAGPLASRGLKHKDPTVLESYQWATRQGAKHSSGGSSRAREKSNRNRLRNRLYTKPTSREVLRRDSSSGSEREQ